MILAPDLPPDRQFQSHVGGRWPIPNKACPSFARVRWEVAVNLAAGARTACPRVGAPRRKIARTGRPRSVTATSEHTRLSLAN